MYAMYQDGATLDEVAQEFDLTRQRVQQLFKQAGLKTRTRSAQNRRKGQRPTWTKKKYSDEELVACLREASEAVGGVLSAAAYNRLAKTRHFRDGRQWPTHQTHFNRFGSWRKALQAAGLRANPSSPIAGKRLFEVGHCIDAIRHAQRELGQVPSVNDYDRIAVESNGALPSLATVRNRCGSWVEALRMAGL